MSFEKIQLTPAQVEAFQTDISAQPVTDVVPLSGGEWSQAFGYKQGGQDYVVRFGQHQQDYLTDRFASGYGSARLPVPKVLEVGEAFGGYYAISERAFGTMLDALDKPAMKGALPSILATLDAIREVDISDTTGFGQLHAKEKYSSWTDMLLDINKDEPGMKAYGWKEGLVDSPVGIKPFEKAYEMLANIARDLPEVRSIVHTDLINNNVLVNNDRITAVIDWANAIHGDFLYDLANFVFWEPIYEPIKGINWESAALEHYKSIGLEVPEFKRRLLCCMLHIGLGSLEYYGFKKDWTYLEPVTKRIEELARSAKQF